MKIKIMESSQSVVPSMLYVGEQPTFKLTIKEIIKYVIVYV